MAVSFSITMKFDRFDHMPLYRAWGQSLGRCIMSKLQKYARSIENLGAGSFARYWWHQKSKLPRTGVFDLTSRYAQYPLQCRARTSDIDVFKHIYVLREYAFLDEMENPGLIIDCGANVGMSTSYFLGRCPEARVIAIEPDPGNYQQLMHNTANYSDRVTGIQAGVWSKQAGLKFVDAPFGDGRAWAICVEEALPGEPVDINAVSIPQILADEPADQRISLWKIDIEGAELSLFSENAEEWLGRVDNLVIELHGPECEKVFYDAIKPFDFEVIPSGGVVICKAKK